MILSKQQLSCFFIGIKNMQIEEDQLTSRILTGCAPVDAVIDMAGDFFQWVGQGAKNLWGDITSNFSNWVNETFPWFSGMVSKLTNVAAESMATLGWLGGQAVKCGLVIGGVALGVIVGPKILGIGALLAGGAAWLGASGVASLVGGAVIAVSAGLILRSLVKASGFIYNFNWNISDDQINQQQKAAMLNFYTVVGGALGESLAGLVCGAGSIKFVQSLRVAPAALAKVQMLMEFSGGPDGFEKSGEFIQESVEALFPIVQQGTRTMLRIGFLEAYQNVRRLIKAAAKLPGIAQILPNQWDKAIESWGSGEAWTFKKKVEDAIEALPEGVEQFTEEFYEEFLERCREVSLQVANSVG
jgi:hypothetical protein